MGGVCDIDKGQVGWRLKGEVSVATTPHVSADLCFNLGGLSSDLGPVCVCKVLQVVTGGRQEGCLYYLLKVSGDSSICYRLGVAGTA